MISVVVNKILFILGTLPLLVYPFVVVASVMGLSSRSDVKIPLFNRIMNQCFLWVSLIYPLVVIACYWFSRKMIEHDLLFMLIPLLFLTLLWGCFRYMDAPAKE